MDLGLFNTKKLENTPAKKGGAPENKSPSVAYHSIASGSNTAAVVEQSSKSESRSNMAVIGGTVAATLFVTIVILFLIGIPQSLAAKLAPKAPGFLSTLLEKIATMGSFARWKDKDTVIGVEDESGVILGASPCIGLYQYLCFDPWLVDDRSGQVLKVQDFDMKGTFEIEVVGCVDRLMLTHVTTGSREIMHFVSLDENFSRQFDLRLPRGDEWIKIMEGQK
jgi:hypothetical protein